MLGRNSYTQEELDHAKTAVAAQAAAYRKLAKAVDATGDAKAAAALDAFEPLFFDHMTMVLDRYFVHRVRAVSGKDGNPLNEVEMLTESLLNGDRTLQGNKVIKYRPEEAVLGLELGDPIALDAAQFDDLAAAFFAEIDQRFV